MRRNEITTGMRKVWQPGTGVMAGVLLLVLSLAVIPVSAASPVVPIAATPTVPAAPPWQDELVPRPRPLTITVGTTPVRVEVANNEDERELGLGYRDGLLPGTGMLFVWDRGAPAEPRTFWMGGMRFCLDIIFLNEGKITGATESVCPGVPGAPSDEIPRQASPGPAEFVLEMPAGFLAAHDYGVDTPYTFDTDPYALPTPAPVNN